ncbi:restriction endonuclease subunit S [Luteimonas granuli]|uniref:Restriction endonuclease subunit S n=1 Tax=Luteimonas granuli TaxID=1176533 RepID=A0A518N127_9GAMM|nr:restriction endonuclease subunit S [Luteimonas granuli]QDW65616.1 restriction endonuclease subunit S [Luteimonas granuli]
MSLPAYPEYRVSDIDWVEMLPAHWDVANLKWVCRRYSGGTPDKNRLEFWEDGTVPWLNSGAVNDGCIYEPTTYITREALESSSAKWIPAGAILMALAGQGKTKGMVAQLMFESTCNQSMAAIVPAGRVQARYLYWWLANNYQNIRNMAGGDLRDGLNLDLLGEIPCPLPSCDEQAAIAVFLDREAAKIDALIAEQEKLLALLADKRQSTISHAVTRGIDPNAPMKDSGIPWLGEVPAHWTLGGLTKFIGPIVDYRGRTPDKGDKGMFLVTAKNVRDGIIDYEASQEYVDPNEAAALLSRGMPEVGDVLFTTEAPLGQVAQIDRTDIALAQRIVKFRGAPNVMTNEYLMYWLMSKPCQSRLASLATGSTALGIKASKLGMIECLVPTVSEQQAIVDFIRAELRRFDALRDEAQRAVELFKERRSALVAAAVTGQVDVRGAVESQAA